MLKGILLFLTFLCVLQNAFPDTQGIVGPDDRMNLYDLTNQQVQNLAKSVCLVTTIENVRITSTSIDLLLGYYGTVGEFLKSPPPGGNFTKANTYFDQSIKFVDQPYCGGVGTGSLIASNLVITAFHVPFNQNMIRPGAVNLHAEPLCDFTDRSTIGLS
jgi:hypothetical protein